MVLYTSCSIRPSPQACFQMCLKEDTRASVTSGRSSWGTCARGLKAIGIFAVGDVEIKYVLYTLRWDVVKECVRVRCHAGQ